jgi:hypothetical protein
MKLNERLNFHAPNILHYMGISYENAWGRLNTSTEF